VELVDLKPVGDNSVELVESEPARANIGAAVGPGARFTGG